MSKLLIIIISCCMFTYTRSVSNGIVYSIDTFSSATCQDRQLEGLFCQTCEIMSTCIQLNNEWVTVPVKACITSDGFYCNMFYGGCSNNTGACNPVGHEINFRCNTEGLFPDPYDCQKYHLCFRPDGVNLIAINLQCTGNSAFSPQTNECTAYINSTTCLQKQFRCDNVGDQNSWPGNSNIFYICASTNVNGQNILFPLLFRCPSNQIHDGLRCVANSGGGEQTTTTIITTTSTETSTTITTNAPAEFVCPTFGLFPYPTNCRMYYICNETLVYTLGTCPTGSYFNSSQLSCLLGTC